MLTASKFKGWSLQKGKSFIVQWEKLEGNAKYLIAFNWIDETKPNVI